MVGNVDRPAGRWIWLTHAILFGQCVPLAPQQLPFVNYSPSVTAENTRKTTARPWLWKLIKLVHITNCITGNNVKSHVLKLVAVINLTWSMYWWVNKTLPIALCTPVPLHQTDRPTNQPAKHPHDCSIELLLWTPKRFHWHILRQLVLCGHSANTIIIRYWIDMEDSS